MNDKGRGILFALAGGYIVYIGISLLKDSLTSRPTNYMMFVVVGVLFVVFGLVVIYAYMRSFFKLQKKERGEAQESDEPESGEVLAGVEELPAETKEGEVDNTESEPPAEAAEEENESKKREKEELEEESEEESEEEE